MNERYIKDILRKLKEGILSETEAYEALKELPYKDLGFANLDNHRQIRTGFPEIVYCQGKTDEQICEIFRSLSAYGSVMGTRASEETYRNVFKILPEVVYHKDARIITCESSGSWVKESFNDSEGTKRATESISSEKKSNIGTVAVVSAGTSDIPVAEEAAVTAEFLGNRVTRVYDVGVAGLHRLMDKLDSIVSSDVVIAVAGMEGALASVIGGLVEVPVIAVPTSVGYGANFQGLSALLSMLNSCANGVATVNIDNGFGAGYMAAIINRSKNKHRNSSRNHNSGII